MKKSYTNRSRNAGSDPYPSNNICALGAMQRWQSEISSADDDRILTPGSSHSFSRFLTPWHEAGLAKRRHIRDILVRVIDMKTGGIRDICQQRGHVSGRSCQDAAVAWRVGSQLVANLHMYRRPYVMWRRNLLPYSECQGRVLPCFSSLDPSIHDSDSSGTLTGRLVNAVLCQLPAQP